MGAAIAKRATEGALRFRKTSWDLIKTRRSPSKRSGAVIYSVIFYPSHFCGLIANIQTLFYDIFNEQRNTALYLACGQRREEGGTGFPSRVKTGMSRSISR